MRDACDACCCLLRATTRRPPPPSSQPRSTSIIQLFLCDAVFSLAMVVKTMSDDATDNVGTCKTLGNRIALIPRLLEQYPHIAELDDKFLETLFRALKDCHDILKEYGKKGSVSRFFQSGGIKKKLEDMDSLIGQCIADLTLSVGITSSTKLVDIGNLVTTNMNSLLAREAANNIIAADVDNVVMSEEEKQELIDLSILDYNLVQFSVNKRGVRKVAVGGAGHTCDASLFHASFNGKAVVVAELPLVVTPDAAEQWRLRLSSADSLLRGVQKFPQCFLQVLGGGVEYLDDEEDADDESHSPKIIQQLFVVSGVCSSVSFLEYVASAEWDKSDLERSIAFLYRITLGVYLLHAHASSPRHCPGHVTPDSILLTSDCPNVPVISCMDLSFRTQLAGSSASLETTALASLRWLAPEKLKTDHRNSSAGDVCKDVHTIGLLMCCMLTGGALPYGELDCAAGEAEAAAVTHQLIEVIRQGQQQPYQLASVTCNPSMLQLLSLCLQHDARSRPSLMFVLRALKAISIDMKVTLPFDVDNFDLPTTPGEKAAISYDGNANDSDEDGGINDFDDMTSQVENTASAVKLFRSTSLVTDANKDSSVVLVGSKVILLNFNLVKESDRSAEATICAIDDGEEDEISLGHAVGMCNSAGNKPNVRGIVIFHIDNTTSMKKNDRNALTKEVLLRVIPNLLRKNFRVIVNAWACDSVTLGKIQTREIRVSPDLLESDRRDDLSQRIQSEVFEILNPSGKTDLYGSIFQLLEQCEDLLRSMSTSSSDNNAHVYCFILTDGNHNHFAYPTHQPLCVDEDYFGVYKGILKNNKLVFGLSGNSGDVFVAQTFLASKYASSIVSGRVTLTLIGIGDAGTAPLSSLASVMGDQCSFVGITEVNQIDSALSSLDNCSDDASSQLRVTFSKRGEDPGSCREVTEEFQFVCGDEDSSLVNGCVLLAAPDSCDFVANHANMAVVFNAGTMVTFAEDPLHFDVKSVMSECSNLIKFNKFSYSLEELVDEVLPVLSQIRSNSYDVTTETFQALFSQLLKDKKSLWVVKTALFSKRTRHFRQNPLFCAFSVWLKELEYLVDAQISSYRMNVEAELFCALENGGRAPAGGDESNFSAQPSAIVLERLKNNLQNTGKKVHQVHRHVTAIRSIRDRTLNLGMGLLSSDLVCRRDTSGVVLSVHKKNGKHYDVIWHVDVTRGGSVDRVLQQLSTIDIAVVSHTQKTNASAAAATAVSTLQTSFPCLLLKAYFDPLTVIRASELFTLGDVCMNSANTAALQFCAEEIWDLCSASGQYVVGDVLPVADTVMLQLARDRGTNVEEEVLEQEQAEVGGDKFNMILPLATSPLLMTLYCERGRLYHNGLNITGDILALTPATGQWAKVMHDIFMDMASCRHALMKQRALIDVALQCIVSYSYAIEFSVLSPSASTVEALFTFVPEAPIVVLQRDVVSGLTCPLGVAMLTAYHPKEAIPIEIQVKSWNTLLVTIFSRLCEAISGQKNIRHANKADPSGIEVPYRLVVGELQTILKRRLHVEWRNSSVDEKMAVVKANAPAIRACLVVIVELYLNHLNEYNLPTFANALRMLSLASAVKNYGTDRLRDIFLLCETDTSHVRSAVLASDVDLSFSLPMFCNCRDDVGAGAGAGAGAGHVQLREVREDDHDLLLAYIDAIVTTNVSPKIVYQPVVHPAFPTFSASENKSLQFEKAKTPWNVDLPIANICLIGNVNSGKSSIGGQLLSHLNIVSDKVLEKMRHMAQQMGRKENVQYAWLMDSLREERAGGYTVKPKFNGFQTATRRFTMIDNPGHSDYAANYVNGIYHSDIVLLVVSAVASEQHLAEVSRSMAEEHLVTAFCFGIKQVVVLVNKMDLVGYSEEAFISIKEKTFKHVKKAGFKVTEESLCIPISAIEGVGFLSIPEQLSWYDGPCFLQALDFVPLPPRHENKHFRMVIDDVFKIAGVGCVVCGKVERGTLSMGDTINIYSSGMENCAIKSMESHGHAVTSAKPGDDIGISVCLPKVTKQSHGNKCVPKNIRRGMIVGISGEFAVPVMKQFQVQLLILGRGIVFKVGMVPTMLTHLLKMQVKITRLVETIGKNNIVLNQNPDEVKTGDTCVIELEARDVIPAETIHDCPKLSRFVIQQNRLTVAIGFIRSRLL